MWCNDGSSYRPVRVVLLAILMATCWWSPPLAACPFCTPVGPSLMQRIEQADRALVAECVQIQASQAMFESRRVLNGSQNFNDIALDATNLAPSPVHVGSLWMLLAETAADKSYQWQATPLNEASYAYIARAPNLRTPEPDRLKYFARFLEHADSLVAEDAYLEFARAPFEAVAEVAPTCDMAKIRDWLASRNVLDARKGLYGLMLGLAADDETRITNRAFLLETIDRTAREETSASGGDFRPGFDGVLGGYLALDGANALELLDDQFLTNPAAAEGHLRHAVTALRFARQCLPSIPHQRLAQSMRLLLARPSFAATAIVDLARWRDLDARNQIVKLYDQPGEHQAATRRAVVGYLVACGDEPSRASLEKLREADSSGVAAAEAHYEKYGRLGIGAGQ